MKILKKCLQFLMMSALFCSSFSMEKRGEERGERLKSEKECLESLYDLCIQSPNILENLKEGREEWPRLITDISSLLIHWLEEFSSELLSQKWKMREIESLLGRYVLYDEIYLKKDERVQDRETRSQQKSDKCTYTTIACYSPSKRSFTLYLDEIKEVKDIWTLIRIIFHEGMHAFLDRFKDIYQNNPLFVDDHRIFEGCLKKAKEKNITTNRELVACFKDYLDDLDSRMQSWVSLPAIAFFLGVKGYSPDMGTLRKKVEDLPNLFDLSEEQKNSPLHGAADYFFTKVGGKIEGDPDERINELEKGAEEYRVDMGAYLLLIKLTLRMVQYAVSQNNSHSISLPFEEVPELFSLQVPKGLTYKAMKNLLERMGLKNLLAGGPQNPLGGVLGAVNITEIPNSDKLNVLVNSFFLIPGQLGGGSKLNSFILRPIIRSMYDLINRLQVTKEPLKGSSFIQSLFKMISYNHPAYIKKYVHEYEKTGWLGWSELQICEYAELLFKQSFEELSKQIVEALDPKRKPIQANIDSDISEMLKIFNKLESSLKKTFVQKAIQEIQIDRAFDEVFAIKDGTLLLNPAKAAEKGFFWSSALGLNFIIHWWIMDWVGKWLAGFMKHNSNGNRMRVCGDQTIGFTLYRDSMKNEKRKQYAYYFSFLKEVDSFLCLLARPSSLLNNSFGRFSVLAPSYTCAALYDTFTPDSLALSLIHILNPWNWHGGHLYQGVLKAEEKGDSLSLSYPGCSFEKVEKTLEIYAKSCIQRGLSFKDMQQEAELWIQSPNILLFKMYQGENLKKAQENENPCVYFIVRRDDMQAKFFCYEDEVSIFNAYELLKAINYWNSFVDNYLSSLLKEDYQDIVQIKARAFCSMDLRSQKTVNSDRNYTILYPDFLLTKEAGEDLFMNSLRLMEEKMKTILAYFLTKKSLGMEKIPCPVDASSNITECVSVASLEPFVSALGCYHDKLQKKFHHAWDTEQVYKDDLYPCYEDGKGMIGKNQVYCEKINPHKELSRRYFYSDLKKILSKVGVNIGYKLSSLYNNAMEIK